MLFCRQFCSSISPLHPVLPALVEVYVNSILVPNSKSPNENTNQPIEEEDIRNVFRDFISQGSVVSASHSIHSLHASVYFCDNFYYKLHESRENKKLELKLGYKMFQVVIHKKQPLLKTKFSKLFWNFWANHKTGLTCN